MSVDQCVAERAVASAAGPRISRPTQVRAIPQLASLREFGALIRRQLVHCGQTGARPAVLLVAVDALADPLAHGEQLAAVGMRLRSRVRSADSVVRIADEFGVFLHGDVARHAVSIRERLRLALEDDFVLPDSNAPMHSRFSRVRPRFGLAIHPEAPISGIGLIVEAKIALEAAAHPAAATRW